MDSQSQPNEPLAPHPAPPPDFFSRSLPVIESAGAWYRLNPVGYASSLYFDRSGKGRFDGAELGYGILYVGEDEYASFIECYGRVHGARGVAESALLQRNLFRICSARPLVIVDLTGNNLVKLGADARLSSGSYVVARQWASSISSHPQKVDGLKYRSRHDDERICYGFFDRTRPYLIEENLGNLVDNHPSLLASILAHYDYGLL